MVAEIDMRTILIILAFFQLSTIYGQTNQTLEKLVLGSVVDIESKKGIPFAKIRSSENQFAKCDEHGKFTLLYNSDSNLIIIGYAFNYINDSVKFIANSDTKIVLKPIPINAEDSLPMKGNPIDTSYYNNGKIESINYQYKNCITFYKNGKVKFKTVNGSHKLWYPTGGLQYQSLLITPHYRRITVWRKNGKIKKTWSMSWKLNSKKNHGEWIKSSGRRQP